MLGMRMPVVLLDDSVAGARRGVGMGMTSDKPTQADNSEQKGDPVTARAILEHHFSHGVLRLEGAGVLA
jgi:hypothetical protein